tara:strand:- start:2731 stop:3027 length:297 start_codon:yes stop_codon:yes gene_type:complete
MSKQPTHVWVVWQDAAEAGYGKGIVAVYGSKADAVKRVREERRLWCRPETLDGDDPYSGEQGIKLSDWNTDDSPHCFSTDLETHTIIELRAVRQEVQR